MNFKSPGYSSPSYSSPTYRTQVQPPKLKTKILYRDEPRTSQPVVLPQGMYKLDYAVDVCKEAGINASRDNVYESMDEFRQLGSENCPSNTNIKSLTISFADRYGGEPYYSPSINSFFEAKNHEQRYSAVSDIFSCIRWE